MAEIKETVDAKPIESARQEDAKPRPESTRSGLYVAPATDIYERDDALVLVADVPGVDHSGVEIKIEDGVLEVTAHRRPADSEPDYAEFEQASYHRAFSLSDTIDVEKIDAEIKDGVLALTLPKSERAKPRRIDVRAG